ncbi:Photosystem I assembly protein Ycf3 [uncultured archaeon]|nr:Photosystem I assembly protein Ycf3 [uncultured archaeon]
MMTVASKPPEERPDFPAIKTVHGWRATENQIIAVLDMARLNNVIIHPVKRSEEKADPNFEPLWRQEVREKGFQVGERRSPGGLTFRTIRIAEDLTRKEYQQLTEAINPAYKGRPIEELLVEEGLRSLLQISTPHVSSSDSSRLVSIRRAVAASKTMLHMAGDAEGAEAKADLQEKALKTLQRAFTKNIPHVDYSGEDLSETQSPHRTLRNLDVVCDQKTTLAHAILNAIAPAESGLKTFPASVTEDCRGLWISHSCLFCCLSDGSYFVFDANDPSSSGRLGGDVLPNNSVSPPTKSNPIVDVRLNGESEKLPRRLDLLDPATHMMEAQYLALGISYVHGGRLDAAEEAFISAFKLAPNTAKAFYNLGLLHAYAGVAYKAEGDVDGSYAEFRKALKSFASSLEINPRISNTYVNVGVIQKMMGHPEEAEKSYRTALEMDGSSPEAHFNLGNLLLDRGELREAEGEFRRVITYRKSFTEAYFNLADVCVMEGKSRDAAEAYRSFLSSCPEGRYVRQREIAEAYLRENEDAA